MSTRLLPEPPPTMSAIRRPPFHATQRRFRNGEITYIDYFGRALSVFNRRAGECPSDLLMKSSFMRSRTCSSYVNVPGEHRRRVRHMPPFTHSGSATRSGRAAAVAIRRRQGAR